MSSSDVFLVVLGAAPQQVRGVNSWGHNQPELVMNITQSGLVLIVYLGMFLEHRLEV